MKRDPEDIPFDIGDKVIFNGMTEGYVCPQENSVCEVVTVEEYISPGVFPLTTIKDENGEEFGVHECSLSAPNMYGEGI